ncbi:MFS transporter [Leifsonia sp. H3M29-4]|uniref:MFS transporter n=1 Tax=Salinibacterium metalliresistens TaxID=3031321 RepID=UPI0023D9CFF2|nr:MFS transporter [Salinibacterium metalliresistens]MDF1478331.1 MFS transporter [Salinibacterium metalliresistens]
MTSDAPADSRRVRGLRLAALSLGQVVSWGVLYYALIVAAPVIAEQTGWPLALVTALFSAGLVTSAIVGIATGRLLDRYGPRVIMTSGSALAVAGFVMVAVAPNPIAFGVGWVIVGAAQSAVLYQAAFTVVARRYGQRAHGAMTIVTLAGGLASTVFAPLVAALVVALDWRATFLVLAAVLATVTIPLHAFSLERRWPPHAVAPHEHDDHTVATVIRTRRFWFLELSMIAITGAGFSVTLSIIPLFTEKGIGFELAALALGLLGAGQVIGRLLFVALPRGTRPWVPIALIAALTGILLAALGIIPGPLWALIAVAVLAGAVRGANTLAQGSAVIDRWGTRNYGAINGVVAAPVTIMVALAPAIGPAVAAGVGGYQTMALVMAGIAAVAALLARWS